MPKLIFTGEEFAGRVYELTLATTTVGRGDHNTLAIHDISVSQTHCEILVNGPEVIVRDLDSRNGTLVHGVRLRNQQGQILDGQIVQFGSVEARLEIEEAAVTDTATGMTAVHAHVRYSRAQLHAAPELPPGIILETGSPTSSAEHTLMLPRSAAPAAKVPPSPVAPASDPRPPTNRPRLILIGAGLVLVIGVLLWLLLRRS